jgi:nucleoside phosphorylase
MEIDTAQQMVIQVPGYEILPISPQYPAGAHISPNAPDSRLKIVDSPIITTDSFLFGTTKNELDDIGCIVEMDDAVIGMVCQNKTAFGFVRNVSDPVINGDLPDSVQEARATYIYQQRGLYTSFNGALGTWAVIAGGHQPPE